MTVGLLALACLVALVATAAPLPVYAATLVLFGFAHVVVELRYVRDRFGGRVDARLVFAWLALLAALATVRAADYARLPIPGGRAAIEVALLVLLLGVTALATRGRRRAIALAATAAFGAVAWFAPPALVLVVLALLHNLTPLGFLAEARSVRSRAFALALVAFLVVPAAIAGGAADALLAALHLPRFDGALLGIGTAADHWSVFVPAPWRAHEFAARLFASAVYLQCAHYFAVLHVLPRLARAAPRAAGVASFERPPRTALLGFGSVIGGAVRLGVALAVAAGGVVLLAFLRDFADGRSLYGIAASVHAWVEWPLFLGLLLGAVK